MPAPAAMPSTAAMVGAARRWSAVAAAPGRRIQPTLADTPAPGPKPAFARSAPEQKSPSAPVTTSTRCPESANSRNAAVNSSQPSDGMAFFRPGLANVRVRTGPSSETVSSAMGREPTERPDAPDLPRDMALRLTPHHGCDGGPPAPIAESPPDGVASVPMGLNPFRKQRVSTIDVVLVAGFVVLTLALVAWGFFG